MQKEIDIFENDIHEKYPELVDIKNRKFIL